MQEHQPSAPNSQQSETVGPVKKAKPSKNLYEPYVTPRWFWVCLRAFARIVFFFVLDVRRLGKKNIPKSGPYIIAANHLSWTDIPLVPAYLNSQVIYLAKEELYEGNLGWLVRFLGAIPVKRGEADRQLMRASDDLLKHGKILIIFPEGTRSKTQSMNEAHPGLGLIALRSGVPVLPIAISGSESALKKFRPHITIRYGEPIVLQPTGKKVTREDINQGTETVMRRIASMLPPSYQGVYGDPEVVTPASEASPSGLL